MDNHTAPGSIITSFTIWSGLDNKIKPIKIFDREDINIGYYWDHCTYHIFGLNRNPVKRGEEGTVMGMSAFGNPNKYLEYFMNMPNFKSHMQGPNDFNFLIEEARKSEQNMFDIASSLQKATEITIKKLLEPYIDEYKPKNLCLSGGVSLNCVLTGKMLDWYPNVNIFCDPIPYDAGLALGSARYLWHDILNKPRIYNVPQNYSSYLGVNYAEDKVIFELNEANKLLIYY
jgi:predicted NodU family carbamoyl transferase